MKCQNKFNVVYNIFTCFWIHQQTYQRAIVYTMHIQYSKLWNIKWHICYSTSCTFIYVGNIYVHYETCTFWHSMPAFRIPVAERSNTKKSSNKLYSIWIVILSVCYSSFLNKYVVFKLKFVLRTYVASFK